MARAVIGLLSPGDMGVGIAKLLIANGYRVITNVSGRSQATQDRATKAAIELVDSDERLCTTADYILSIVPPRDALATAQRVIQATAAAAAASQAPNASARNAPLYFLDLNAISPQTAREIHAQLAERAPTIRHIDGGIIGAPPVLRDDGNGNGNDSGSQPTTSYRPSIPVSGPHRLDAAAAVSGEHLAATLNVKHIGDAIGAATGLKMCFASLSKGLTGLAIQCYTTAAKLGVTAELQAALDEFNPAGRARAERSLTTMPPKAYRWVYEMEEIAATFEADGGFRPDESSFRSIARVYDFVANGTALGAETTEHRVRGTTAEDTARVMAEATAERQRQT